MKRWLFGNFFQPLRTLVQKLTEATLTHTLHCIASEEVYSSPFDLEDNFKNSP